VSTPSQATRGARNAPSKPWSQGFIRTFRAPALLGLLALFVLIITQLATDDLIGLRLTTIDPSSWYRAEFQNFPSEFKVGAEKVKTARAI
jgi:hypothetical protein